MNKVNVFVIMVRYSTMIINPVFLNVKMVRKNIMENANVLSE